MKPRQFALAFAATFLTGAAAQVPPSAPILPDTELLSPAPAIGAAHKLTSTYFLDRHADRRPLAVNGYTSVVTFRSVKCTNTKGCNIGFDAMVQVLCRNMGTDPYEVAFYLVSEVDGAYGAVAPFQSRNAIFPHVVRTTYYEPIGAPFILQNYQDVADGSTNSGALQVEMVQISRAGSPDFVLGDWTVSITVYGQ